MPLYDYDCAACGSRFEVNHSVHGEGPSQCPQCGGGPVRKAFAAPAIHFKGSGWAKKERRATATSGTKAGSTESAGAPASGDAASAGPSAPDSGTTTASSGEGSGTAVSTAGTTAD